MSTNLSIEVASHNKCSQQMLLAKALVIVKLSPENYLSPLG